MTTDRHEPPDPPARHRPDRLLRRPVRHAQLRPGLRGGRPAQRQPRRTPGDRRATSTAAGRIVTADGVVVRPLGPSPVGGPSSSSGSTPTGDLFGHVTGYFSFTLGADGVERSYNDELAGRTDELSFRTSATSSSTEDRTGDVTLTVRTDVQQVARDALGERRGSVVALDPRRARSWPCGVPRPTTRTSCRPTTRPPPRPPAAASTPIPHKPLLARAYQERSSPARRSRSSPRRRARLGVVTPDQPGLPVTTEFDIDFTDDEPSATSAARPAAARCSRSSRSSCNTAFARWASTPSAPAGWSTAPRRSASTSSRPSTCRPGARPLPHRLPRRPGQRPARPGVDRPGRRGRHPAADGAGRRRRRQRRRGHGAPRARPRSPTTAATSSSTSSRGLDPAMSPATSAATMREAMVGVVEDGSGHARRSPASSSAARPAPPARHRPAVEPRLVHRLRRPPGQAARGRGGRDRRGAARRERGDRWPGRRADRPHGHGSRFSAPPDRSPPRDRRGRHLDPRHA